MNDRAVKFEIERKYLIEMPDFAVISKMQDYKRADIEQTYLVSCDNSVRRVRRKEINGEITYTKTEKRRINNVTCIEDEIEISESEFANYMKEKDEALNTVIKTRKSFYYVGHTIEIDIYPFWDSVAIMEVELESELEDILFPDFIKIIREVTDEKEFKNRQIASKIPSLNM